MKNAALSRAARRSRPAPGGSGNARSAASSDAPPIRRRRAPTRTVVACGLVLSALSAACSESPVAPDGGSLSSPAPSLAARGMGVVQHLTVGSNDLCPALGQAPGCDANFSLVANKWADGTVRGQWQDGFGRDADGEQLGGIHVSIDCLEVMELNIGIYSFMVAWVSGVITHSTSPAFVVGEGAITAAVDRGTSANDLFEDLGTFSLPVSQFPPGTTCADRPELPVFLGVSFIGQVDIWSR